MNLVRLWRTSRNSEERLRLIMPEEEDIKKKKAGLFSGLELWNPFGLRLYAVLAGLIVLVAFVVELAWVGVEYSTKRVEVDQAETIVKQRYCREWGKFDFLEFKADLDRKFAMEVDRQRAEQSIRSDSREMTYGNELAAYRPRTNDICLGFTNSFRFRDMFADIDIAAGQSGMPSCGATFSSSFVSRFWTCVYLSLPMMSRLYVPLSIEDGCAAEMDSDERLRSVLTELVKTTFLRDKDDFHNVTSWDISKAVVGIAVALNETLDRKHQRLLCMLQATRDSRSGAQSRIFRIIFLAVILAFALPALYRLSWEQVDAQFGEVITGIREAEANLDYTQLGREEAQSLLHQLYPQTVAHSLVKGIEVKPETFESVTIYFSDIVGFVNISAISSPLEVITFLHAVYVQFDQLVDTHDIYKVETIGDAYMLVSGLPHRNGIRHAGEIATVALQLQSVARNFVIPHLPETRLMLRSGFHSGTVIAGVVGLKMPRYCLFGDTVNTASRMESTGQEWRVHLSEPAKFLLDELQEYDVEYRGETMVKGKNTMRTYWLLGKRGQAFRIDEASCEVCPRTPVSPLLQGQANV